MWCKHCQQDVPAIGSTDDLVRCARCRQTFSGQQVNAATDREVKGTEARIQVETRRADDWLERALEDDWELDDELNEAHQLAKSLGVEPTGDTSLRIDAAHVPTGQRPLHPRLPRREQKSFFSWCMLSLGLMAFVFGAVLVGWSFVEDRPDLWQLGLPFTLGGQAALIVGLVFQLDALSRSNREAIASLDELDEQLDELRHATSMLSTTHSNPAKSFYAHLAEGASPNLLLADLKGQLDLLASRMSEMR